jgi:hypothetical protein
LTARRADREELFERAREKNVGGVACWRVTEARDVRRDRFYDDAFNDRCVVR